MANAAASQRHSLKVLHKVIKPLRGLQRAGMVSFEFKDFFFLKSQLDSVVIELKATPLRQ